MVSKSTILVDAFVGVVTFPLKRSAYTFIIYPTIITLLYYSYEHLFAGTFMLTHSTSSMLGFTFRYSLLL